MSIQQSNIRLILPNISVVSFFSPCDVSFFLGESEDSWSPSPSTKDNKTPEEREAVHNLYFFFFFLTHVPFDSPSEEYVYFADFS